MSSPPAPAPNEAAVTAAIVYNPKAGKRRSEATALANALVAQHDIIVAVGGDGTINEVVNGMAQASQMAVAAGVERPACRLGIVPAGTVNVLALELKIP